MGGAFGHIMHPFEDLELPLCDLRGMLDDVAGGRMDLYEKFDGVNLMFRYDGDRLTFTRTPSELRSGGMDAEALADRFSVPEVGRRMRSAAWALAALVDRHSEELTGWFSLDVISRDGMNVVRYDEDAIVIHPVRVLETGFEWQHGRFERWHERRASDPDGRSWSILAPGPRRIVASPALDHGPLDVHAHACLHQVLSEGIQLEFMRTVIDDRTAAETVAGRILKRPGHRSLSEIKRMVGSRAASAVSSFVNDDARVIRRARSAIEGHVRECSIRILDDQHSSLVRRSDIEIDRMRRAYFMKLNELTARGEARRYKDDIDVLGELDELNTTVEGIVFRWRNGRLYKLVGLFKHLNQIMGAGRYRRHS